MFSGIEELLAAAISIICSCHVFVSCRGAPRIFTYIIFALLCPCLKTRCLLLKMVTCASSLPIAVHFFIQSPYNPSTEPTHDRIPVVSFTKVQAEASCASMQNELIQRRVRLVALQVGDFSGKILVRTDGRFWDPQKGCFLQLKNLCHQEPTMKP